MRLEILPSREGKVSAKGEAGWNEPGVGPNSDRFL